MILNLQFRIQEFYQLFLRILNSERHNFLLWIPIFQSIGIMVYFSLQSEPTYSLILLIYFLGIFLFFITIFLRKNIYFLLTAILFFVIVGFCSAKLRTNLVSTKNLRHEVYAKNIYGIVKSIQQKPSYIQLVLTDVRNLKYQITDIRISVRTEFDKNIAIGDQVILSAKLYPPPMPKSEFSYDFAKIAYFSNISAIGYATSKISLYKKIKHKKFFQYIETLRQYIYRNLHAHLNKTEADVASALLIGKKEGIDNTLMENIRNSGVSHLFAISGLHLAFVTGLFFLIIRNLLALSEKITLKYDIKKIAAVISIFSSLGYLLITDMPISAQRAFIMVLLVFISILISREHNSMRSIMFAGFVILIFEPESILGPSFQMSFAAVLALISSYDISTKFNFNNKILQYFFSIVLSSIIASAATAPYVIYNFNYFSIGGILANLLAIPITTFSVIPLGMMYMLFIPFNLEFLLVPIFEYSIDAMVYVINKTANMGNSIICIHSFPVHSILMIAFGFVWLCIWKEKWRLYGILFIMIGIIFGIIYQTPDVLIVNDNGVIKEIDGKIYSLTQRNKNFMAITWAKQNGQKTLTPHKSYESLNKFLNCNDYGCIYKKHDKIIAIANKADFVTQNCKSSDLIIQFHDFPYPKNCNTPNIRYFDLKKNGTHYIWAEDVLSIHKIYKDRPWYNNSN